MTEVSKAHVVIFGATGGIGSALVALLRQQGLFGDRGRARRDTFG